MNETDEVNDTSSEIRWDGTIRKAHPVLGALVLTIPLLPMMCVGHMLYWSISHVLFVHLLILLAVPFTAVATTLSVLFVCVFSVILPSKLIEKENVKKFHGMLKTAESGGSALQTCLGKSTQVPVSLSWVRQPESQSSQFQASTLSLSSAFKKTTGILSCRCLGS